MSDIHVLPIGDLREHEETRDCWCHPRVEGPPEENTNNATEGSFTDVEGQIDGSMEDVVVVHNSLDGRELVEEHGVN